VHLSPGRVHLLLVIPFALILVFKLKLAKTTLIATGGMLLGSSLRGNIVGINNFYQDLRRNEDRYLYQLSTGATHMEAIMPYVRKNLRAALAPSLARTATMGVVSLPGMLTGQILGGSNPFVVVKYQIAVMITIFVAMSLSTALTFLLTTGVGFTEAGILKKSVFTGKEG